MSLIEGRTKALERIGARMRAVTIALILATPVLFVVTMATQGVAFLLPIPREISVHIGDQSAGGMAILILLAALKPAVFLLALVLLQDLFGLYRAGDVFGERSARRIRQLGWTLILIDLADIVQRVAVGPLLSSLDASAPFVSVGVGLSFSIVGAFVIVIGKVMDLGRELQDFERLAI